MTTFTITLATIITLLVRGARRLFSRIQLAASCAVLLVLAILSPSQSWGDSIEVTVNGTSGPWVWANGGLNTTFQYGFNNHTGPTIVSATSGLAFTPGDVLLVQYVSGFVYEGGNWPQNDADGALFWITDDKPYDGAYYPSLYFNHADYPAFAAELAGTFADSSGVIVGTPFKVGSFRYLAIPTGATCLQLGNIDNYYSDNSGAWQISITETNAPPPVQVSISPAVAIRWSSDPTHDYQVQWASRTDTNTWLNLGSPVTGNGSTNTIYDTVGQGSRFYRILTVR